MRHIQRKTRINIAATQCFDCESRDAVPDSDLRGNIVVALCKKCNEIQKNEMHVLMKQSNWIENKKGLSSILILVAVPMFGVGGLYLLIAPALVIASFALVLSCPDPMSTSNPNYIMNEKSIHCSFENGKYAYTNSSRQPLIRQDGSTYE